MKKHPEKRHLAEIADFRFEIWIFLKTTLEIFKSDISEKSTRKRHLVEIADFRFEIWIFLKTTLEI